ncbi:MAG: MerR family transcriptional regulator [Tepidiformaceae bacterium]
MLVRIGILSQQSGVSADVLRSWERRYGLFTPERTAGGFRLYTDDDLRRVMLMKDLIAAGVSPAEAARQVLTRDIGSPVEVSLTGRLPGNECRVALAEALRSFSEASLEVAVDMVFARLDLDSAIREVFIPCLRDLGSDWAEGRATIGQEHFGVNALRGRLMGLSRGWDRGLGPRVVLARKRSSVLRPRDAANERAAATSSR